MPFAPIGISSVKPVCKKECPDRTFDCHAKCEKYKEYRERCDAEIVDRNKKTKLHFEVNEAVSQAVKRLPGKRRY